MKFTNFAMVCYQFNMGNLQKQPWNYIYQLSKGLKDRGCRVTIITDGAKEVLKKEEIDGLQVYRLRKIRPSQKANLIKILANEKSELIIWSIAPKSIGFYRLFKSIGIPIVGFLSHSLYSMREVIGAQAYLKKCDLALFIQNVLIPKFAIKTFFSSRPFSGVIVLSQKNRDKLLNMGCRADKVWYINHAKEKLKGNILNKLDEKNLVKHEILLEDGEHSEKTKFLLYLGGAEEIRGPLFLIKSFAKALQVNSNLRLVLLLRSDVRRNIMKIEKECERVHILTNVLIVQGIKCKEVVYHYIRQCDFVLLPFILIPSEVPISILEAMSLGKPVIGTDVDGIPELISNRGIVVPPGDEDQLTDAILRISEDSEYLHQLSDNCLAFMANYPTWGEVTVKFLSKIESIESV